MPGINFIYDVKGRLGADRPRPVSSKDSLFLDEAYEHRVLLDDDFHHLSYTAYPGYPVESIDGRDWTIYFEGRLYGRDTERKITELAGLVFGDETGLEQRLRAWLLKVDGDFVAFLLHKQNGQICIINDLFARLPLYCYRTSETLVLSRDLRFVANCMDRIRFDRMAIAECLWMGYLLGRRTLLENVDRLPPATWLRINQDATRIQVKSVHRFNFELRPNSSRSCNENASELAEIFTESCQARIVPGLENVISLSGGIDSRAVAACFHKARIPFRATTFIDHEGVFGPDARIAEQIANLFNIEWQLFRLPTPGSKDILKLLKIKSGMNSLGMSFLLPYLEGVRKAYGPHMVFVTGDGGQVLRDSSPSARLTDLDGVVEYLISRNAKFPLQEVVALTGVTESEIVGELRTQISSYPEEDWGQKCVHFVVCERALQWHSEGEDRNRFYFWSITPLYSVRFFNYVMGCPEAQKSHFGLYREFLRSLSPAAADLHYAGWGAAVTSDKFRIASRALAVLGERADVRRAMEKIVGSADGYRSDSMIVQSIRQQMTACDSIFEYFSRSCLRNLLEECVKHTKEGMQNLFTITSTIEELMTGGSVLEQHGQTSGARLADMG